MATKRTVVINPVAEEGRKSGRSAQDPESAWNVTIKMIVPMGREREAFYSVTVDDRKYDIPANGTVQELPLPVAKALNELLDEIYAAGSKSEMSKETAEETKR